MRICRRSASRALFAALTIGIAAGAVAQLAGPSPRQPHHTDEASTPNAREAIGAEGEAAMERLKGAVAGQKDRTEISGTGALPAPTEAQRRRAFDAMRAAVVDPAMERRARAAEQAGDAAIVVQREAMAKRLNQALGLEAPEMEAIARASGSVAAKAWVPVLFVSSSMPVATLRTYAAQLERAGGVLAFRGMPGGLAQVAPMAKLSAEILRLDPGCVGPACAMRNVQLIVDPIVFRQHGISRVPALAMIPGDPALPYCERDDDSPRAAHIIHGDAALSGLLEEYARLGGEEEVQGAQARLERR